MPAGVHVTVLIAVQNVATVVLIAVTLYGSAMGTLEPSWYLLGLFLFLVFLHMISGGTLSHPRLQSQTPSTNAGNQPDPPQATPTRQSQARTEQQEYRDRIAGICDELDALAEVSRVLLGKGDGCADVVKRLQTQRARIGTHRARIGPPPPPYDATPPPAYST